MKDQEELKEIQKKINEYIKSNNLELQFVTKLTDEGLLRAYKLEPTAEGQPGYYMALSTMVLKPDDLVIVPEGGQSQFTRFVQDFVNTPLTGVNQVLMPYLQFRLLEEIEEQTRLLQDQSRYR